MARRGSLSPNNYFPNNGDMLENHSDGICWVAERLHKWFDDKTGVELRYGLLIGRVAEFGDTPLPVLFRDDDDRGWLEGIDIIHRKKAGGHVAYKWNEVTETWQQEG